MLKNIFTLGVFLLINNALADDQKNSCTSINDGAADKVLDLSIPYIKDGISREELFSVCKVMGESKYFVILDDLPFEPKLVFFTSAKEVVKSPKRILHYNQVYESWIISLDKSEFKSIEMMIDKLKNAGNPDGYEVLDAVEICINSTSMKSVCYVNPQENSEERGLQPLIQLMHLLEGKFSKLNLP